MITKRTNEEFRTVDLLLANRSKTNTTDAFILSYVKFEKQMRRLVFLLLRRRGVSSKLVREFLAKHDKLGYQKFRNYFDRLHSRPFLKVLDDLAGNMKGRALWNVIDHYSGDRNKIFHCLLTENGLEKPDLRQRINTLQDWCELVGQAMQKEIGYDGLRKPPKPMTAKSDHQFSGNTLEELQAWLEGLRVKNKGWEQCRETDRKCPNHG